MRRKEDKSLFLEHFGDTPQLRVFDFLIGNYFFDFRITKIARGSNVSYNSIITFFDINNNFVKDIIRLNWRMVKADLGLLEETKKPLLPASKH